MTGKMKTHRIITAILLLQCLLAQGAPRPYNSDSLRQIRKNRAYRIKGGVEIADLYTPVAEIDKYLSIPDAQAGYFAIEEFYPDNTRLIKKLRKSILNAQKQGCDSFILDLRGNPGGYGANFDRLLSLFVDKESIPYLRRQYLQVSNQTVNDYDFLTEASIGRKVALPEGTYPQEIKPDRSCFIPDMRYYVLMDKDTGSIAASLCNILQYNGAAQLVGEPLERNALKYGETIDAWLYLSPLLLSCSTMEYDEYTRAENGVLMPDIAIPYVAQEYLADRDGMLEKLLELLKTNRQNGQATANLRTNPSNLNQ